METVKDYGAVGNGAANDTAAIQRALDSAFPAVAFPPGNYLVDKLTLTRKVSLVGEDPQQCRIRSIASIEEPVLKVAITDNYGYQDVRHWRMESLGVVAAIGGRTALDISGGMAVLTSKVDNCILSASAGGLSLYVGNEFSSGLFSCCTFTQGVLAEFGDANLFSKCMFFGDPCGLVLAVQAGCYNNAVESCTFATRDGGILITSGDCIRIWNNQIEHSGAAPNQSRWKAQLAVVPSLDVVKNLVIEANNLGGGLYENYGIYLERTDGCVVQNNQMVACAKAEVLARSSASAVYKNNKVRSQVLSPRGKTPVIIVA